MTTWRLRIEMAPPRHRPARSKWCTFDGARAVVPELVCVHAEALSGVPNHRLGQMLDAGELGPILVMTTTDRGMFVWSCEPLEPDDHPAS